MKKASNFYRGFSLEQAFTAKNQQLIEVLLPISAIFVTFLFHHLSFCPG
jgi:hypothetical protein